MPTPAIIDGFDHRVQATVGFGADTSARLWSNSSNPNAISFDSTVKRTGAASLKIAQNGATATYITKGVPTGNRIIVGSVYFRLATAPSSNSIVLAATGPTNYPRFQVDASGVIQAAIGSTVVNGPNIVDGNWHRLDWRWDTSTATFTIDWQVDGTSQTQASLGGQTAVDITGIRFGSAVASNNATVWFDDFVASYASADYPLGEHAVRFLVPNDEGVHNNPANTLERASDGADIDGTNVVAWSMLDEWPPTSGTNNADTVTQVANNTAAYVEVQFADITDSTVWGVEALAALQSDGTQTNNGQTRIRRSDGTETTVWSGGMNATSPRYMRVIVAAPSGGWTQAGVNALRARIGYSTDTAPQPEWLALALQVAVVESGAGPSTVSPALIDQAGAVFAPAFALRFGVGLLDYAGQTFSPAFGLRLSPALIDQAGTVLTPSIHLRILPSLIDQSGTTFTPTIGVMQFVSPVLIDQAGVVFAPGIRLQVVPALIDQSGTVFGPAFGLRFGVGLLDHAGQAFSPKMVLRFGISLIDQAGTVFAPGVRLELFPSLIDRAGTVFAPLIQGGEAGPAIMRRIFLMRRRPPKEWR